nr:arabinan endo-1,5-alpha-L-arabinosidase [uncultured Bacteroides sp.]
MIRFINICPIAFFFLISACGSDDNPASEDPTIPPSTETYTAPTYKDDYSSIASWENRSNWNLANVHDPTVAKCGDYYYMYSTDASYGNAHDGHGHFLYRRSKDLVNWEFKGMAMSETPAWVKDTLNNMRQREGLPSIASPSYGCWAPVVRKVGSKYRMYYSIVVDNYIKTGAQNTTANFDNSWTEHAFIGLMETDDLASNIWVDKGMVVCSSTDRGNNWYRASLTDWSGYFKWNAIDPSFIVTPNNEQWLIYGSWHSGIVAVKIDPNTGKPYQLNSLADYGTCIATRTTGSRWQGSEAPEIIYNENTGYYYLFLAYDELSVAYNTRVCRSKSITGPFVGIDGKDITQGGECWPILTHPYKFSNHSGWVGISHCCIFQNPDTKEWYYGSQGRLPANTNGNAYSNAIMMGQVRSIEWTEDGWPVVMPERYAAVPQSTISESELIGNWEHITLSYQYQIQQVSKSIVLSANKTVSGAISGNWSYDATKKILTIGTYKVKVQRGLDWEATPRTTTIIYSGLTDKGISLWGKKVK